MWTTSPTELRTPMTVMGTPSTLTVSPTGSTPLNSSDAVVDPSTATAACVGDVLVVDESALGDACGRAPSPRRGWCR